MSEMTGAEMEPIREMLEIPEGLEILERLMVGIRQGTLDSKKLRDTLRTDGYEAGLGYLRASVPDEACARTGG